MFPSLAGTFNWARGRDWRGGRSPGGGGPGHCRCPPVRQVCYQLFNWKKNSDICFPFSVSGAAMKETLWELVQAQPPPMCELSTNQKPACSSLDQSEAQSGLTSVLLRNDLYKHSFKQNYVYFDSKCILLQMWSGLLTSLTNFLWHLVSFRVQQSYSIFA